MSDDAFAGRQLGSARSGAEFLLLLLAALAVFCGSMAAAQDGGNPPVAVSGDPVSLSLRVTPPDARIRVMNIKGAYKPGMPVKPGLYHIIIDKPGFETWDKWLKVEGARFDYPVKLKSVVAVENNDLAKPASVAKKPRLKPEKRAQPVVTAQLLLEQSNAYLQGKGVPKDKVAGLGLLKRAAEKSYPPAMYELGRRYRLGHDIEEDYDLAFKWHGKAAKKDYSPALISLAHCYQAKRTCGLSKNRRKNAKWFKKVIDKGFADALNKLGMLYENAQGDQKDIAFAFKLYSKAAIGKKASKFAMFNLGRMHQDGVGVRQDFGKAKEWFQKAKAAGNPAGNWALANLRRKQAEKIAAKTQSNEGGFSKHKAIKKSANTGKPDGKQMVITKLRPVSNEATALYQKGQQFRKRNDYVKAVKFWRRAAEKGHLPAMISLALCYRRNKSCGVSKNLVETAKWFQKAADAGHAGAMNQLGILYQKGHGVRENKAFAVKLFHKAATAKPANKYAMYGLGLVYQNGIGTKKNFAKAREWFEKSDAAGNVSGKNALRILRKLEQKQSPGKTTAIAAEMAFQSYEKNAKTGNIAAMVYLARCYQDGSCGMSKDYVKALKWYRKAADRGHVSAMMSLAGCYNRGKCGVSKDFAKTVKWYQMAADTGYIFAMHNLATTYEFGKGENMDLIKARYWAKKAADRYIFAKMGLRRIEKKIAEQKLAKGMSPRQLQQKLALKTRQKMVNGKLPMQRCDLMAADPVDLGQLPPDLALEKIHKDAAAVCRTALEANPGSPRLQYQLGRALIRDGKLKEGQELMIAAAKAGHISAMYHIAGMVEHGAGFQADMKIALFWYTKAAELGDPRAMTNLARLYALGLGVEGGAPDLKQAEKIWRLAAQLGNLEAGRNLLVLARKKAAAAPGH